MTTQTPYLPVHLKRWTMPPNYFGSSWPDHYVFLSRNRDSDELTESNFRVALEHLKSLPPFEDEYSRSSIRESHWAVGWVEWIAIHADDYEALKIADEMAASLESYPVLDEEDFSNLEHENAAKVWRECYSPKERVAYMRRFYYQFEPRDWRELMGCARGNYFLGYASELLN